MADSPGRLLSSICLGGGGGSSGGQSTKYGSTSCVNIFLHLFDWNRRLSKRGLFFSKKLLPATIEGGKKRSSSYNKRRRKKAAAAMMEVERLPMAKLLLIAQENRRTSSNCGGESQIGEQEQEEEEEAEEEDEEEEPEISAMRSLQELLHSSDHEDLYCSPKMLQEFLRPPPRQQQQQLLSLLLQEAKAAASTPPPPDPPNRRQEERNHRRNLAPSTSLSRQVSSERPFSARKACPASPISRSNRRSSSHRSAAGASVVASGCGGFGRRITSGLFLEAAAKILDPRSHSSKLPPRVLPSSASSAKKKTTDSSSKVLLDLISDDMARSPAPALRSLPPPQSPSHSQVQAQAQALEEETRPAIFLPSHCFSNAATTKNLMLSSSGKSVSAPCSPGRAREEGLDAGCSIRSLMELFLDDLEEDLEMCYLSRSLIDAVAPSLSPPRPLPPSPRPPSEASSSPNSRGKAPRSPSSIPEDLTKVALTVDDLQEHDYISFRDFLTSGSKRLAADSSNSAAKVDDLVSTNITADQDEEQDEDIRPAASPARDHDHSFGFMVHNPLFEENRRSSCCSELDQSITEDADDHGLEEILKSILHQTTSGDQSKETSRLTWTPDSSSSLAAPENFMYNNNKDGNSSCSDESHQMDSDSVELTSESNCGEDCGQPSPVSVLDSPFDDELSRKVGKRGPSSNTKSSRKRLEFTDDHPTTTSTSSSSGARFCDMSRIQKFEIGGLEEAEDYITMVLEESGICYHANVMTLLVAEGGGGVGKVGDDGEVGKFGDAHITAGIIGVSVFERIEDRLRVQQLIEHLEACSTSSSARDRSSRHSQQSLREHYEQYHESRSRRRMVFDFVNEILGAIVAAQLELDRLWWASSRDSLSIAQPRAMTGSQLAQETHRQAIAWKRRAFHTVHELVDMEIGGDTAKNSSSCARSSSSFCDPREEICEIELSCEQHILKSMVEELARDLLSFHATHM